jgi:hypothetical protein
VPALAGGANVSASRTFTCSEVGAYRLNNSVNIFGNVTEIDYSNNNATLRTDCFERPITCNLTSNGNSYITILPTGTANVSATCYDASHEVTACPVFDWSQTLIWGSMDPTQTPSMPPPQHPKSILRISGGPELPQFGKVTASSATSGVAVSCSINYMVADDSVGPNYHPISISAFGQQIDTPTIITVSVKNIGNLNGTNATYVRATFSGPCTPIKDNYKLEPIDAGDTKSDNTISCKCNSAGKVSVNVIVNPPLASGNYLQSETNYNDNDISFSFNCLPALWRWTCPDFV